MPVDAGTLQFQPSGNTEKLVKKVVDYKLLNGKRYYKVKWKCTWEVEDSLLPAQDLVDQFWGFVNRVKSEDSSSLDVLGSRVNTTSCCTEYSSIKPLEDNHYQSDLSNINRQFPEYHSRTPTQHYKSINTVEPVLFPPCKTDIPNLSDSTERKNFQYSSQEDSLNLDCEEDGIADDHNTSSEDILLQSSSDQVTKTVSNKKYSVRLECDTPTRSSAVEKFTDEKIIDLKMKRKHLGMSQLGKHPSEIYW